MKVKKEATVAVVIGLILALLVTGGVLRARRALESVKLPKNESVESKNTPKASSNPNELFLELTTPDNSVTNIATFAIAGKTKVGSYIAILGEKGEYLIVPNELGNFSQEITLVKGANTIKLTVYLEDGTKTEKTINVVYTTAEI